MKFNSSHVCGLVTLTVWLALAAAPVRAGDIFIPTGPSNNIIAEYNTSGTLINPSLITTPDIGVVLTAGGNLFFLGDTISPPLPYSSFSQYTTAGAQVGTPWDTGVSAAPVEQTPFTASGNDLWEAAPDLEHVDTYFEWSMSGTLINTFPTTAIPVAFAVSGGNIFADFGTYVSEYTTSGTLVNPSLITGLQQSNSIAVSGSNILIDNATSGFFTGYISQYTTSGAPENLSLVTDLFGPSNIAIYGGNLFVESIFEEQQGGVSAIGEYTMSGTAVVAPLITNPTFGGGLGPFPFVVTPKPATWILAALGLLSLRLFRRRR
jgi:hypothetical protein